MTADLWILSAIALALIVDVIRNHLRAKRIAEFERNRGNFGRTLG